MRKNVQVVDTLDEARKIRETFVDRPSTKERKMPFAWPSELREIGRCEAVMYTSDKWKDRGDYEDYKHIAEAPQEFIAREGFLRSHRAGKWRPLRTYGPTIELVEPMPRHFAVLSPLLGVQIGLYRDASRRLGQYVEVTVPKGLLGGARHPKTGAPFLIIYTEEQGGLHGIVTGKELDIEKDGIVG
jgi:hypothetical protein